MHPKVEAKLKGKHVYYTVHRHASFAVPIRNPQDFANALGYDLARITKTLFIKGDELGKHGMVVCSTNKKVDFALLAREMRCKRVQVAKLAELQQEVGFPPTGVSPLGVEELPIFLDEGLFSFESVLIGAGEVGVEIEVTPIDLKFLTGGIVINLVKVT